MTFRCNFFRYENFCDLSISDNASVGVLQLFFNWRTRRMCNLLLAQSLSNSFNSPKLIYACLLLCFSFADRNTDTHTRTHTKTHTEGSCEADNENEARKQWKRWTTGPEAQQTQRGDRSHTDTEQCKYPFPVNPPFKSFPDGQHSLMSSSIYRLPALSSAREVSTFRRCELRYLQRANCTKKPIKKMKYLDNKTQRLQKQMINWILD